ncbi:hypothetical protein LTR67_002164 [Exophiala xenobiotica]
MLGDHCTLYGLFSRADPEADAVWFEGRSWTYREIQDDADRLATLFDRFGVAAGECVAVFTTNSVEMITTCLALSKLGAIMALINTNLRDATLRHCIDVAGATVVVTTPDLQAFVPSDTTKIVLNLYSFAPTPTVVANSNDKSTSVWTMDDLRQAYPSNSTRAQKLTDVAILIYTSGTTGKPKACAIRNMMIMTASNPLTSDVEDAKTYFPLRTYSPLPLFHGTAFFGGLSYAIACSGTLCLRRKFSASHFWEDMVNSRATRMLYVGELCRYLLSTPKSTFEDEHKCIVATGNGLRRDIWQQFMERFNIPEIREFYRSTEGLAKFDNHGKGLQGAGMVGFAGPLAAFFEDQTFLIKVDQETQEPFRDPVTGFCRKARLGEPGEAIGRCRDRDLLTRYYGNDEATDSKMMANVFRKGDLFQRMGDLLVHERSGWVRFADRLGDTFRWKGENVSTAEVRDLICSTPNVQDAVVYGVKLDKYDGQAGAAAIVLRQTDPSAVDRLLSGLWKHLRHVGLPDYGVPRLLRITSSISVGDTYKQAKKDFVGRSWDPRQDDTGDQLYVLDNTSFRRLDDESWQNIQLGRMKL